LPRYFRASGKFLKKEKPNLKVAIVFLRRMSKLHFDRKILPPSIIKRY
jgi:hypothetical protein